MPLLKQSPKLFIYVPFICSIRLPSTRSNANMEPEKTQGTRTYPQVRSGIPSPSSLHIGENRMEPPQVQAALLGHVLHEEAAAGGKHLCPLPAQPPDLNKTRILSADLSA